MFTFAGTSHRLPNDGNDTIPSDRTKYCLLCFTGASVSIAPLAASFQSVQDCLDDRATISQQGFPRLPEDKHEMM